MQNVVSEVTSIANDFLDQMFLFGRSPESCHPTHNYEIDMDMRDH